MTIFSWRLVRRVSAGYVVLSMAAACAMPGPQHALIPQVHGLAPIAPGVFSDAPKDAARQLDALAQGRARAEAFHTGVMPDRMILCTAQPCARQLGIKPNGLAYGHRLVLIGPEGITPAVMGHELSHVALARQLGPTGQVLGRIPRWFDEGLAVWLSPDPRYTRPEAAQDAEWITQARSLHDWNRLITEDTWPEVYGAAGRVVEDIANQIRTDGLHQLIEASVNGADFDATLARLRAAP